MNQVCARTATRNPAIRLLLVGLAFILFNLYVTLRDHLTTSPKNSFMPPTKEWLSLPVWLSCSLVRLSNTGVWHRSSNINRQMRFRELLIIEF